MSNQLLGYKVTLSLTPPASQGKPRPKVTQDLVGPVGTIMSQGDAQLVNKAARQALQMVELGMLAAPGLDPGQSNLTFSTSIDPVYADVVNNKLTNKP